MFFYYLNFESNYQVLKSKSLCILLNKNINLNKNETELMGKIPYTVLERRTLCFTSYKNRKLKAKLWWDGACERKQRIFFVPLTLSNGNLIWQRFVFLPQCILYWMHFQNIHTFTYQKTLLHTLLLLLIFKMVESIQCILNKKKTYKTGRILILDQSHQSINGHHHLTSINKQIIFAADFNIFFN